MEKAVSNRLYRTVLAGIFMTLAFQLSAQSKSIPALERKVSLTFEATPIESALKKLGTAAGCTFSYKSDVVSAVAPVSGKYADQPVRVVLDSLFGAQFSYRSKENYIILKKNTVSASEAHIEGYVIDGATGNKVPQASIYDLTTMASTISDDFGYYSIRTEERPEINLTINKEHYKDTIIYVSSASGTKVNIEIYPVVLPETLTVLPDSLYRSPRFRFPKIVLSEESKANLRNLKGKLSNKVQFSVLPFVGTNGRLSGSSKVDYSFNLLGGFNYGVRVLEIGAFANINWDSVRQCQLAGFMNLTGGPQQGFQAAGFVNLNHSHVKGVQAAGFTNVIEMDLSGAQMAGFTNFVLGEGKGVQVAGFSNVATHGFQGGQFAGFINVAHWKSSGIQVAGFLNTAPENSQTIQGAGFANVIGQGSSGIQIAGFLNAAGKDYAGLQAAGFLNAAGDNYKGIQVAGFLNTAKKMKGMQIGTFNFCDSIDGLQLGFFSYSRYGLHQLEIAGDELFPVNLSFRTGTHRFYNLFTVGMQFSSAVPMWTYGYGIGTSFKLSEKQRLFVDLRSNHLQKGNVYEDVQMLNKLTLTYQYNLTPKIAIAAGPTLNFLVISDVDDVESQPYMDVAPYSFYDRTFNDTNLKMWVGGQVAIRFF